MALQARLALDSTLLPMVLCDKPPLCPGAVCMGSFAPSLGEAIQFASGSRVGVQRMPCKQPALGRDEESPHQISEYEESEACQLQQDTRSSEWIRMASTSWTSSVTTAPFEVALLR